VFSVKKNNIGIIETVTSYLNNYICTKSRTFNNRNRIVVLSFMNIVKVKPRELKDVASMSRWSLYRG